MKKLAYVSATLLVVAFLAAPAMAATIHGTKVGPARFVEWSMTKAPNTGSEEITLDDDIGFCCLVQDPPCANPPDDPDFNVGDTLTVDSYFQDTVPDSPDWVVEFTAGVKQPGRPVIVLFDHEPVDFGPVPAGTWTFCVSYKLGPLPNKLAGQQDIATGFGVQSDTGTLPPGPYNTFDVNP